MGTRRATVYLGMLISALVSFTPKGDGGLGLCGLSFGTPAAAKPADDLYLDFSPVDRRMIVTRRGQVFLVCDARNEVVRPGQYGHWGYCPPGWYRVCPPANTQGSVKFGPNFMRLADTGRNGGMARARRDGIGIHGGGTGLKFAATAAYQGWKPTLGCVRMQNRDLIELVRLVRWTLTAGGKVWIKVGSRDRTRTLLASRPGRA